MTLRTASDMRALAAAIRASIKPLTTQQIVDKYAAIFDKIYTAASSGLNVVNVLLTDTQYEEFAPVIESYGYGISYSLPTEMTTIATNSTGITYTGYIDNGAGANGRTLTVTACPDIGLGVGIPVIGTGVTDGTYISADYASKTVNISSITSNSTTFTVVTSTSLLWTSGQTVTISGVLPAAYNGTWTVATSGTGTSFSVTSNINPGTATQVGVVSLPNKINVTGGISTLTDFTIYTQQVQQWIPGAKVTIEGVLPGQYNGTWTIASSLNNTQFTVTSDINPGNVTQNGTALGRGTSAGVGYYTVNQNQLVASSSLKSTWITTTSTQGMVPNAKVDFRADIITTTAWHTYTNGNIAVYDSTGLYPGMPIRFSGTSLGGIQPYQTYYIVNATDNIITLSTENASGVVETWTDDATAPMSVVAGGAFGALQLGSTYYVNTVPDGVHFTLSKTIGGDPLFTPSQIGYMTVRSDTAAASLSPATPIYTGSTDIGNTGNSYVISWI